MTDEPTGVGSEQQLTPTCYRHTGRETHIRCQRCERPICPDCMHQASVGFHCPECVKEGARTTRQARTAYGGRRPGSPGLVTTTLIAINLVVFVLVAVTGGADGWLLPKLALIPVGAVYLVNGQPEFVDGIADGAYWQLVTSMFTHVEIWHIGFNMLALYVLGPQLELVLGRARFLALYLLSGLVGSATVYWLAAESSVTVGASGSLFGLMAALLVVAVKVRGDVQGLLTLVAINVAITIFGRGFISWQGHLGGFVGGLLLALVLVYAPRSHRTTWQVAGVSVIALATAAAVVARTLVLQ
jgi:membrane associated rhomboid family serine protease